MKPVLLILLALGPAPVSASADDGPVASTEIEVAREPVDDLVVAARAHATVCYNLDGSISDIISHTVCADGWGPTWEAAAFWATIGLSNFVCLGPYPGCCEYVVDQDFNSCGK